MTKAPSRKANPVPLTRKPPRPWIKLPLLAALACLADSRQSLANQAATSESEAFQAMSQGGVHNVQ